MKRRPARETYIHKAGRWQGFRFPFTLYVDCPHVILYLHPQSYSVFCNSASELIRNQNKKVSNEHTEENTIQVGLEGKEWPVLLLEKVFWE